MCRKWFRHCLNKASDEKQHFWSTICLYYTLHQYKGKFWLLKQHTYNLNDGPYLILKDKASKTN